MEKTYEYGRIQRLAESLGKFGIPEETARRILAGGESIRKSTDPRLKAAWLKDAMLRMDALLDAETRQAVRQACACCLGGKRLQISKAIAKEHATLEERVAAANEARFVFGHSVTREADGRIRVSFGPDGPATFRCPCLSKAEGEFPLTYCYCCGGHVKHHLQIALGRKLECTVLSSVLSTAGRETCRFSFRIVE